MTTTVTADTIKTMAIIKVMAITNTRTSTAMAKKTSTKRAVNATTIDEQLRAAIIASEHKPAAIARETGVSPGMLSRFLTDDAEAPEICG